MQSSSAWAVGSPRATVALCACATTMPSRNTAAPTGTSPADAARRASSSAAVMPSISEAEVGRLGPFPLPPSPAFSRSLRTRRFWRRARRNALERQVGPVLRAVHPHTVPFPVLSLEHGERERVLQEPLDGALQGPGPVDGIVALRDQELLRRRRHLEPHLSVGHESLEPRDLEIDDLADVLARERSEDDGIVHAVQELRPERLAQQFEHLGLNLLPVLRTHLEDVLRP